MPDFILIIFFLVFCIGGTFISVFEVLERDSPTIKPGLFAIILSFFPLAWFVYAYNAEWKYITTTSYANISLNSAIHTVVMYEDSVGVHLIELPYYLQDAKKYEIKIPDRNSWYRGVAFIQDRKDKIIVQELEARK